MPEADLATDKSGPDTVFVGEDFTYTLTATNNGPDTATGVTLIDDLPDGVSPVDGGLPQGCTFDGQEDEVTCDVGRLESGQSVPRELQVQANSAGQKQNVVRITGDQDDPDASNNRATAATTAQPEADLTLEKTDSEDPVLVGQEFTYTLDITNDGPSTARGVTLTDRLPDGVSPVEGELPQDCAYNPQDNTITCQIGDLQRGESVQRQFRVTSDSDGGKINRAEVTSNTADRNTDNNDATEDTTVQPAADLTVQKRDSQDPVLAGEEFTYTVTVTNDGPSPAANVSLTDRLPEGVTPTDPRDLPGGCTYDAQEQHHNLRPRSAR